MKEKIALQRIAIIAAILFSLTLSGLSAANAADKTNVSTSISQIITSETSTEVINPPQTQGFMPPNISTAKPSGLIMKWVCKTLSTTVAISAWVYTVVVTEGVAMVIAREVIRYVTVPAIVCDWFF
jgi:hypothetical protein